MEERFKTFTVLIAKINRSIRKIKTEEMSAYQLKSPHVSCLYYLYKADSPLTAKELCDICEEDKANVSRSIKFLEQNEYITCHSKYQKRYQTPLELTEKGRCVGEMIAEKIDNVLDQVSDGLSEEERCRMYHYLSVVQESLQAICNRYENRPEKTDAE